MVSKLPHLHSQTNSICVLHLPNLEFYFSWRNNDLSKNKLEKKSSLVEEMDDVRPTKT